MMGNHIPCNLELRIKVIQVALLIIFLAGCGVHKPNSTNKATDSQRIYWACENLRSSDPTIARQAIDALFSIGGLEAYAILQLKWIAESNPEIRKYILEGFSKVGDHRYIADPEFPEKWYKATEQFYPPEKEIRLRELKKYFPEDMRKLKR